MERDDGLMKGDAVGISFYIVVVFLQCFETLGREDKQVVSND